MIFRETPLAGAYIVEMELQQDERGFFARTWCAQEFAEHGLDSALVQCNLTRTKLRGTLRGMHYQRAPHQEAKLVRCSRGAIFDVIIDLRPDSPTWTKWFGMELSAQDARMLFVPKGCAHGFVSLEDDCETFYQMSQSYHPESAAGVRWNDPAFHITWPEAVRVVSERDNSFPDFVVKP